MFSDRQTQVSSSKYIFAHIFDMQRGKDKFLSGESVDYCHFDGAIPNISLFEAGGKSLPEVGENRLS